MANEICAIQLGRNAVSYTTRDEAKAMLRDDMAKALVSPITAQASQLKNAHEKLRTARFYSFRDASDESKDIRNDNDRKRAGRWLSPTRDMIRGPVWDVNCSQPLFTADSSGVPVFGRYGSDSGMDHERFVMEVDKLNRRGLIKDSELPDFDSDDSMIKLFGRVQELALEEAQGKRVDMGTRNRVIDSAPGLYLFSELLKRTNILIEEDFTELWARRIFAIRNLNTWMPQWLFRRVDTRTTLPEYINIERLPSNAQRGSENVDGEVRNLAFWHHAASWSKLELMRWAEAQSQNGAANFQLDRSRIDNAIRMMNFKEDLLAFFGDDDVNILGLFSPEAKTRIARVTAASLGGGFGASSEQDRELLIRPVRQIRENTERILRPDTIMLSLRSFDHVATTLYGSVDSDAGANKVVYDMAFETLSKLGIKEILEVPEVGHSAQQEQRLKAQGLKGNAPQKYAGGTGDGNQDMVVCNREPHVMEMIVAKDRVMYPAQEEHRDQVETRMMQGGGGLAVYKPAGCTIVTDVGPAAP